VLFNSTSFAIFFAVVFTLWLATARSHKLQNVVLTVASYLFYGSWDPRFLALLWFSTLVDFGIGLALDGSQDERRRKRWITLSVVTQLSILGFFKYFEFFRDGAGQLLALADIDVPPRTLEVVLPVGVSFYTFQTMSYTIDVYRRVIPAERSLLSFAAFASMFPQLVAGPIERARNILPQVNHRRPPSLNHFYEGSWLVLWGLFKKVFIADNAAALVDASFANAAHLGRYEALVALYAFALQIYCDFSGYTDIARGTARILGFDFALNFARPYLAQSPVEFWQRWHISLSSWLRDYLYIPLGGNRGGQLLTCRNLMLTMLLGGLWHGASLTFVVWGAFHGALLVAHRLSEPWLARLRPREALGRAVYGAVAWFALFHAVVLGWLPFRAKSLQEVGEVLQALAQGGTQTALAQERALTLGVLAALLVAYELVEEWKPAPVTRMPVPSRAAFYAVVLLALIVGGAPAGQAFIYFQF
jgi:D-alanyl-lipoteichoic acid acyltransferase DltB (MBOAT superfamily)